jgi:predicted ester cyclase
MYRKKQLFFGILSLVGLLLMSGLLFPRISAAQDDTNEAHRSAIQRIINEGFNQGNADVLDEVLAPDFVSYTPGSEETTGIAEFKQDILAYRAAMPDLQASADPIIVEGDWVAFRFTMTGTFQNDLVFEGEEPIPATGQPFTIVGHIFGRFNEEGLLVEEWDLFDTFSLLEQLGMLDDIMGGAPPAEGGEPAATEEAGGDGDTGALDGDALVSERCTVCHTRERIDNADKDEAGWTETVDRMIGYGAQLNEEERAAVIQYLVETH